MSWLCDSASHMQDICSGVKLLMVVPSESPPIFPIFVDTFVELQVDNSWGYWGLPSDVGVRFCGCAWWLSVRADIEELLYCPPAVFRCTPPIWLLQSLFGGDSWSELSDILRNLEGFHENTRIRLHTYTRAHSGPLIELFEFSSFRFERIDRCWDDDSSIPSSSSSIKLSYNRFNL